MTGRPLIPLACAAVLAAAPATAAPARRQLRVCSDPNNLPFSNDRREGFENALAEILARQLNADLSYTWWPQRRGFLRQTLKAGKCDVVMGVPAGFDPVLTTRPVYRSRYVFVLGPKAPMLASLDAPALRGLRIGIPLVGDDGANPPPEAALVRRNLIDHARGYVVYGDYRQESPPSALIQAVARGEIDVAIAWGPLAGYYAHRAAPRLRVVPVPAAEAPPGMPFTFDIAIGVRKGDRELRDDLDAALAARRRDVDRLLARFHFPTM
jgi:mxaJ protein